MLVGTLRFLDRLFIRRPLDFFSHFWYAHVWRLVLDPSSHQPVHSTQSRRSRRGEQRCPSKAISIVPCHPVDANLGWPDAGAGTTPTRLYLFLLFPAFAFDVARPFLRLLTGHGSVIGQGRHEKRYLREKVFEHAQLVRLATVIKLIDLVNKERLIMECRSTCRAGLAWGFMGRTTVPPRRVDLSVLVVVHDPSADPTAI